MQNIKTVCIETAGIQSTRQTISEQTLHVYKNFNPAEKNMRRHKIPQTILILYMIWFFIIRLATLEMNLIAVPFDFSKKK